MKDHEFWLKCIACTEEKFVDEPLAEAMFARIGSVIEEINSLDEFRQYLASEKAEAQRQADFYDGNRFYHENVAAARKCEARVCGALLLELAA